MHFKSLEMFFNDSMNYFFEFKVYLSELTAMLNKNFCYFTPNPPFSHIFLFLLLESNSIIRIIR